VNSDSLTLKYTYTFENKLVLCEYHIQRVGSLIVIPTCQISTVNK